MSALAETGASYSPQPPTPEQLFQLAGKCVKLDKTGRTRLSKVPTPSRRFTSPYATPQPQTDVERLISPKSTGISRQIFGYVGLQDDAAGWYMHLKETSLVYTGRNYGQIIDLVRSVYRFRWTGSTVLKASRRILYAELEDSDYYGTDYQPAELDKWAYQSDLFGAAGEFATVTSEECTQLQEDIDMLAMAVSKNIQPRQN